MKALITGADGFAGPYLAERLLDEGFDVVGMVHPGWDGTPRVPTLGQVQIERCDIRDKDRLARIIRDTKPERVFHLAALSSPANSVSNPSVTYETNFIGTLNLLTAIYAGDFACRFLYVSSSEVCGLVGQNELPLKEEAPYRPANPYAGSKAAGELLTCQFVRSHGIEAVCVRPFNHTGPRQSAAFVCSSLARQVAEIILGMREPVIEVGNLAVSRDFTDVRDMVRGYYLLLERGVPGEIYQLCSGHPVSIQTILDLLTDNISIPIRVVVDPARVHSHSASTVWGVADKARQAVGWEPQYSLQTTLLDLRGYWEGVLSSTLKVKS